jgi:hypothetical protein
MKPRITVLAVASSNLADRSCFSQNMAKQIFNKEKCNHNNMQTSAEERIYRILWYNLDVMSAVN